MCHFVVRAAQFEAEYWLLIFTLQENLAFEAVAEVDRVSQVGPLACLVDAGRCAGNEAKVL